MSPPKTTGCKGGESDIVKRNKTPDIWNYLTNNQLNT